MIILPQYRRRSVQVKLTAMIDVVFLLIIFFMTVSQIDKDLREEIPLPLAEHGQEISDRDGRIVINVMEDGSLRIARRTRELSAVQEMLRQRVASDGGDEVICVLRIHKLVAFKTLQKLLGSLANAGVWQIRFSVIEDEP